MDLFEGPIGDSSARIYPSDLINHSFIEWVWVLRRKLLYLQ